MMHGAEQKNYCPTAARKMMEAPKEMEFHRPGHVFCNGRLVVCRIVRGHDWNADIMRRRNAQVSRMAQFGWKQRLCGNRVMNSEVSGSEMQGSIGKLNGISKIR